MIRLKGMYGDGFNTLNTSALTRVSEWGAFTGRVDWKIAGDWKQYDEFTSWDGDPFGVMIGGAGHVERQEFGTTDNGEVLMYTGTADVSVKFGGANLYGAVFRQAMLFKCDLRRCGLSSADLRGARLVGCLTNNADLDGAIV